MRKKIYFYFSVVLLTAMASCSNDRMEGFTSDGSNNVSTITITAGRAGEGDTRVGFVESGNNTASSSILKLQWQEGDVLRLFDVTAGDDKKVADFIIDPATIGPAGGTYAGQTNATFSYKGDLTIFQDGHEYKAVIIGKDNADELASNIYPTYIPEVLNGNAADPAVLSQCILSSTNNVTFNGKKFVSEVGDGSTALITFQADFSILTVLMERPSVYTPPVASTNPMTIALTTAMAPLAGQTDSIYNTYMVEATTKTSWTNTSTDLITIYMAVKAGEYGSLRFDVVDSGGTQFTTYRTTEGYNGENTLPTNNMEPDTRYTRKLGAAYWVRTAGYYISEINTSPNANIWTTAKGIITILDGCEDPTVPGYMASKPPQPGIADFKPLIRTNLNNRTTPLAVNFPYLKKFPAGNTTKSSDASAGCFVSVGTTAKKGIGKIMAPQCTEVGAYAFYGNSKVLTDAYLPNVTNIGNYAFQNCNSLQNLDITSVKTIGEYSFNACSSLPELDAPELTSVGSYAFRSCTSLASLNTPKMETIGTYGFASNTALPSVDMPVLTSLGTYAFSNCKVLTSVDMPILKTISNNAFEGCVALPSVSFPAVETIGTYAFSGNTLLTDVDFPECNTVNSYAFQNDPALTKVSLPRTHTLGDNVFAQTAATATNPMTITLGTECCTREGDKSFNDQVFKVGNNLFNYRFSNAAGDAIGGYNYNSNAGTIDMSLGQGFARWTRSGYNNNNTSSNSGTGYYNVGRYSVTTAKTYAYPGIQNSGDGNDPSVIGHYWWTNQSYQNYNSSYVYAYGKFNSIKVVPLPNNHVEGESSEVLKPETW